MCLPSWSWTVKWDTGDVNIRAADRHCLVCQVAAQKYDSEKYVLNIFEENTNTITYGRSEYEYKTIRAELYSDIPKPNSSSISQPSLNGKTIAATILIPNRIRSYSLSLTIRNRRQNQVHNTSRLKRACVSLCMP